MKKIVIIARDYPKAGGRLTHVKNLIEGFENEFDFKVISFNKGPGCEQVRVLFENDTMSLWGFYFFSFLKLMKFKLLNEVDLIFTTGLSAFGGVLFGKIFNVPVIHNTSGFRGAIVNQENSKSSKVKSENQSKKQSKLLKYLVLNNYFAFSRVWADRSSIELSNKTILPSTFNKKDLESRGIDFSKVNCEIIEEGVENKLSKLTKENLLKDFNFSLDKKTIALARIEHKEDLAYLYERLKDDFNVVVIEPREILIGQGDDLVAVDVRIAEAFEVSDVLVLPPRFEPHSSTVLEALSLGLPVILSPVGWLKDEFEEYPELFTRSHSNDDIVSKVYDFNKNPDDIKAQSEIAAIEVLKRYNQLNMLSQYRSLFLNTKTSKSLF